MEFFYMTEDIEELERKLELLKEERESKEKKKEKKEEANLVTLFQPGHYFLLRGELIKVLSFSLKDGLHFKGFFRNENRMSSFTTTESVYWLKTYKYTELTYQEFRARLDAEYEQFVTGF